MAQINDAWFWPTTKTYEALQQSPPADYQPPTPEQEESR